MNLYGYEFQRDSDLAHYGVIGMKWGVRRYQNADGTLTAEGRKRAKSEYRSDNKKAFQIGKDATIASRAYEIAKRKEEKYLDKYSKNPSDRNAKKYKEAKLLAEEWGMTKNATSEIAKKHYEELVEKYGNEAVSRINVDKNGMINEEVHSVGEYAANAALSVGALAASILLKSPVTVITYPKSKNNMAKEAYKKSLKELRKQGLQQMEEEHTKVKAFEDEISRRKKTEEARQKTQSEHYSYLQSNKSSLLDRAKKSDLWDLDYLEIAPETLVSSGGSRLLKDYERYLNDPEKYIRNR